jgi:hypothetical protein
MPELGRVTVVVPEVVAHPPATVLGAASVALASRPLRPPWRSRETRASSHPAGRCRRGNPAGVPGAKTWPSPPEQGHPRGSNRAGEERRANEELSRSPGQVGCV